jgi:tetratricopeptide (TPR) repeat protein
MSAAEMAREDLGWPHRFASSALFHLGHFPESLSAALRARRLEPSQWQPQVLVAQAAVGTGDLRLAAEASAEALRLAPHEPDALFVAGRVYRAQSDYERAEAHVRRALAEDPLHAGALNELGRLELAGHNPVRAVRMFARAAAAAPQSRVSARNAELAVIRAAALVIYIMVAAGGTAEVICTGLKFPMAGPLAVTWVVVGCLLALAAWRISPATRQLIARLARQRRVAVSIGIIAAGATIALISIPVIINSMNEPGASSLPIPFATPVVVIGVSRIVAMAVWRERR